MYDKNSEPAGTTNVSMEQTRTQSQLVQQTHRWDRGCTLWNNSLKAGFSLAKVDTLRSILEEGALRLTHSSHLADYMPVIHGEEKKLIHSEIESQDVHVYLVIFDGTTCLGKALAVVLRFFSGWKIHQRLV